MTERLARLSRLLAPTFFLFPPLYSPTLGACQYKETRHLEGISPEKCECLADFTPGLFSREAAAQIQELLQNQIAEPEHLSTLGSPRRLTGGEKRDKPA